MGRQPLHVAAENACPEAVEFFLKQGINIDMQDNVSSDTRDTSDEIC